MQTGDSSLRRLARAAAACALTGLALAGCGGDDESPGEEASAGGRPATETVAQPPLETVPDEGGGSRAEVEAEGQGTGGRVAVEAETESEACPDVVITPDSGDGLFEVEAQEITCDDAGAALEAWGRSGYPGEGPQGFACEPIEATAERARLRCEQHGSGAVVEFETGN